MATECKVLTITEIFNGHAPDVLEEHLRDGWQVKEWRYDHISDSCKFYLLREVPDHDHTRSNQAAGRS